MKTFDCVIPLLKLIFKDSAIAQSSIILSMHSLISVSNLGTAGFPQCPFINWALHIWGMSPILPLFSVNAPFIPVKSENNELQIHFWCFLGLPLHGNELPLILS